jgi:predicted transcriptional regulator
MKKTKFFALAGLVTLAVVSVFGTKPTRKFATVTKAFAGSVELFSGATSLVLTTGSGHTAQFRTTENKTTIVMKTSGGSPVRFN